MLKNEKVQIFISIDKKLTQSYKSTKYLLYLQETLFEL